MNDKFSTKDPKSLKTEIEKLISFEEKDDLLKSPRKATNPMGPNSDKNPVMTEMFSKYATVRSCSFIKHSADSPSATGIGVPTGGLL